MCERTAAGNKQKNSHVLNKIQLNLGKKQALSLAGSLGAVFNTLQITKDAEGWGVLMYLAQQIKY